MEIIKGYGLPFPPEYSSCSNLSPKNFRWSDGYKGGSGCIEVFIDRAITNDGVNLPYNDKKFGWFCESRYIVKEVYDQIMADPQKYKRSYRNIFTCDQDLIDLDPNFFIFSPSGSNLPWVKQDEMKMYEKSKMCSMVSSSKGSTYGHRKRLEVAGILKDRLDLTGGAHGSPNSGSGYGPQGTWWRSKLPSLQEYRFQVVFENSVYDKYYTEKITDCFATGTVPIYWGTKKVCDDFNENGIIFYDDNFDINSLTEELYESLLPYIKENLERVKLLNSADDIIYKWIKNNGY